MSTHVPTIRTTVAGALHHCRGVAIRLGLVTLLGATLPVQALGLCAAPPVPESRTETFDARLFGAAGTDLSVAGRARLNEFVQGLSTASLEAIVISLPVPAGRTDIEAEARARLRANTLRLQLVAQGVPREHIYLERREARVPAEVALAAPLVVETVGAWPRQAALHRGWRCLG